MAKRVQEGKTPTSGGDAPAEGFLLGGGDEPVAATPAPAKRAAAAAKQPATPEAPSASAASTVPGTAPYTVLARRYRSRDFDELVGQEPIAQTLQNAIATGRTAHAYLFCGTRGVGKTSMARIFAKALNVTDDLMQKEQIAQAILRGDDLDVIEIDGASYRGINEARELIAGAGLSPARCQYKVYIIDEVHQLTRDAFNALLKTMEEPPRHVKFILCTTEPSKVPATIQSRCQRFDFRAIPTSRIAEQLRLILAQEGLTADEEVVAQVARLGHGSMRDALSILDRVLAAGSRHLTAEQFKQLLGMPEQALVARIVDAVVSGDPAAGMKAAGELLATGTSIEQALESLMDHLRDVMVAATCGLDSELLELSAESKQIVRRHAQHLDAAALVYMIALCEAVARNAKSSSAARSLFEATVVRLCLAERLVPIAQLLEGSASASGPKDGSSQKKKPGPELTEVKPAAIGPAALGQNGAAFLAPSEPMRGDIDDPGLWRQIVQAASASHSDRAKVEHLRLREFDGRTLRLSIAEEGASMSGWLRTQGPWLVGLVQRTTGRSVKIEIDSLGVESAAAMPRERQMQEVARLPVVARAMELLDAMIVDVQPAPPPEAQPAPAEESAAHV